VLTLDIIAEVRSRHLVSEKSISSIARSLKISRPTVRKHLSAEIEPVYIRDSQPEPKLGSYKPILITWLEVDYQLPKNQRRTAQHLFEGLVDEGYQGAYDSIHRFVKLYWSSHTGHLGNEGVKLKKEAYLSSKYR
jgi:DNA-binding transcriptional ArsR family regulator